MAIGVTEDLRDISLGSSLVLSPTGDLIVIEANGGRVKAGQIARRFSHSWPTVTRHLGVLRDAGLVEVEVEGRERSYTINKELLFRAGSGWFEHFAGD